MAKQTTLQSEKTFTGDVTSEEFLRLPRLEYLLENAETHLKKGVENMVMNLSFDSVNRFSMAVPDNRMSDAGLRKGDHVIVEKRRSYLEGDVLVVQLGERIFIRRYFRSANRIRLECNTPDRQSMILDKNTPGFAILGNVIQVIREL